MRRPAGVLAIVLGGALTLLAADSKLARVIDPPALPDDVRLGKPVHLDNPAPFKPEFKDRAAWEARARQLREQVLVANGLWPVPEKTPLQPVIHGKIDRDEYTIEKVYFASLPGHYVSGNLYRPKGRTGRLPAVLCPHGHWANGRFYEANEKAAEREIAAGAEKTREGARYPLQARCSMLARMGCVVFFYDMVGYADSKPIEHRKGFTDAEAELRLQSFMGLQTWNSIRALDFLTSLPDVDPGRVAVTGASGGGTQTFMLCAVDDRPAVSFPAVMVSTAMQGGCICENCSLLRVGTNNIELAALFAPKPQAMTGADDWTKEIETKGLPQLKQVYGLYGAADRVHARYAPFPHNYNQVSRELMYNWVNKHLGLGLPEPVAEKPFVPVPPAELSVFDAEHPRPGDAADAETLRKYLSKQSDEQLVRLAASPEAYRQTVAAALRALVLDQLPDRVEPAVFKALNGDGFAVHQALLTRPASGEQVPSIGLVPSGWNGTVVVYVHPQGKAGLFEAGSDRPVARVRKLLEQKTAVLAPDLFLTGEFNLPDKPTVLPPVNNQQNYAGYRHGYNRAIFANRVHDLLTVLGFARGMKARAIHLVAEGKMGPPALLARALAGDAVTRAVIDLNGFDFDQVKDPLGEMMLPGGLKYGGMLGFAPLCTSGETILCNPPASSAGVRLLKLAAAPAVSLREKPAAADDLVELLVK